MGADLIAAIDWSSWGETTINVLKVALGLGFVIFVHELGHFVVAKLCGVKCEKFYIGFDIPMPFGLPSKLYKFQWGETEYGIGILPLGGYVKMLGQDDNPLNAEQEAERTRLQTASATATSNATPAASPATPVVDPRSYTAKSVPQRMAIISAGVIVNLIFAVIFATYAYQQGVKITPCDIGQVIPGGPAWEAGMEPNTRILQIGENGKRSDKLRFDWDLRQGVALHGDRADLFLLVRDETGKERPISVRPATFRRGWDKSSSIGITPAMTLVLRHPASDVPAMKGTTAAKAAPTLKNQDRIVAIDGQAVTDQRQLTEYLAQRVDQPVTIRVERPGEDNSPAQTLDVIVQPQSRRTIGAIMEHGAITAIRPNSPAAKAGFREGDVLKTIDGQPLHDPMTIPQTLRPLHGREIEVVVSRAGQDVTLRVTPETPKSFDWDFPMQMPNVAMSSQALGLAFEVLSIVKEVVPDSPAAKAGLRAGDKLIGFQARWKDPSGKNKRLKPTGEGKEIKFADEMITWPVMTEVMQHISDDELLTFLYERGNSAGTATISPISSDVFQPDRGFLFEPRSEMHIASSFGEAVQLGFRQTWEDATRVLGFLKKLVTGRVSVMNLGGIGSIAYVASNEASEGISRLLIFLTMLSANLAVLNFLPIPALDGGHMMFLMYEGLFRKPVNERIQVALTIFGVVCLLGLMIFVNALDVNRFFF